MRTLAFTVVIVVLLLAGHQYNAAAHFLCQKWAYTPPDLQLRHYDLVDRGIYPEYSTAIYNWNNTPTRLYFTPGSSISYDVKSVNAPYGDTGWPGLMVPHPGCPTNYSDTNVLLNDTLMVNYTSSDRLHVECQELGHATGLDHAGGYATCMSDSPDGYQYTTPGQHAIDDLNVLYP